MKEAGGGHRSARRAGSPLHSYKVSTIRKCSPWTSEQTDCCKGEGGREGGEIAIATRTRHQSQRTHKGPYSDPKDRRVRIFARRNSIQNAAPTSCSIRPQPAAFITEVRRGALGPRGQHSSGLQPLCALPLLFTSFMGSHCHERPLDALQGPVKGPVSGRHGGLRAPKMSW